MKLRRVEPSDADVVFDLIEATWPGRWSRAAVSEELAQPSSLGWLAEQDGRAVGYLLARSVVDEAEVMLIGAVEKRCGVGTALLQAFVEHVAADGVASIHLEVAESNGAARAFYARCGFAEAGRRANYYGSGADAVLLRRAL